MDEKEYTITLPLYSFLAECTVKKVEENWMGSELIIVLNLRNGE
jgi:hypothetical protein